MALRIFGFALFQFLSVSVHAFANRPPKHDNYCTDTPPYLFPFPMAAPPRLGGKKHSFGSSGLSAAAETGQKARNDTNRKRTLLVALSCSNLVAQTTYSIMAPFYPGAAAERGMSPFVTGLVFSIFAATAFPISLMLGSRLARLGRKRVLLTGVLCNGIITASFATVFLVGGESRGGNSTTAANGTHAGGGNHSGASNGTNASGAGGGGGNEGLVLFAVLSLVLRILAGAAAGCAETASFALLNQACDSPSELTTSLGIMEAVGGLGMMAGPPLGGALYDASGGATVPFVAVGALSFPLVAVLACTLPADAMADASAPGPSVARIMLHRDGGVLLMGVVVTLGFAGFCMLEPTLETHLEATVTSSKTVVGLLFLAASAAYAITAPFLGLVVNRAGTRAVISVGLVLVAFSFVLLGPSPVLPFKLSMGLVLGALVLLGASAGGAIMPTMEDMLETCKDIAPPPGRQDERGLDGKNEGAVAAGREQWESSVKDVVSGTFNGMFALGEVIGPMVGGALVQGIGFPVAGTAVAGTYIALALVVLVHTIVRQQKRRRQRQRLQQRQGGAAETSNEEDNQRPLLDPTINAAGGDAVVINQA